MKKKTIQNKLSNNEINGLLLIPIMIIVGIVPLIVFMQQIKLDDIAFRYFTGVKVNNDVFSYTKMQALIFFTSVLVIVYLFKFKREDFFNKSNKIYYVPIFVFAGLLGLSTVLSKFPSITYIGFVERYEGFFVLFAYLLILIITLNMVKTEIHYRNIIISILASAFIICLIGVFQYLGYDFYQSDFGKSLMFLGSGQNVKDIKFNFGKYAIYASLYHYNYVGSYTAMLFPLCAVLFAFLRQWKIKIITGVMTALTGFAWFGCNARSGMIGVAVAVFVMLIVLHKYILRNWKIVIAIILFFVLVSMAMNTFSQGYLYNRAGSLINDIFAISKNQNQSEISDQNMPLKSLKIKGFRAEIVTNTETLNMELKDDIAHFTDEKNTPLNVFVEDDKGILGFKDTKYKDFNVFILKSDIRNYMKIVKNNLSLIFAVEKNKFVLTDNKGIDVDLTPPERWGFEGKEKLGSSRGYIWSRTIPLLKNAIILGYGPDTFAAVFPQNDIFGKMYAYDGDMWQIVDKPHNIYLQTAINSGVLSLLALLALFGIYIVDSFKLYFRRTFNESTPIVGLALFIAVCGYLGAGFFNDSVVSVAPVFWVILGTGIAVNRMVKAKDVKEINKNVITK